MEPASADDAHRRLEKSHNLAGSLSHVETRQVRPDYTLRMGGKLYQIDRQSIVKGLRLAEVRVEMRLDSSMAVRFGERYLKVKACAMAEKKTARVQPVRPTRRRAYQRGSDWDKHFDLKKGPKVWQASQSSGYPQSTAE